ncbi:MAG: Unknown protein [uncultured Sulfurovum sp.]|uniref:Lipoprotein n=1 Tax=uncultured Sulfurovum sp. TaxID=269237 RepID=A0A6S6STQ7_9BACT|nr:MAG: Unknown protein [uncultured Sulfurovum sp.]
MNKTYLSLALMTLPLLFSACGGSSSSSSDSKNDGKGSIDFKEYFPIKDMSKLFITTQRDGDDIQRSSYSEVINVNGNAISTTVNTKLIEKVVFTDTNITTTDTEDDETTVNSIFRNIDLGDTLFTQKQESTESNDLGTINTSLNYTCILKSKEEKFEKGDNLYSGDLLKIECVAQGNVIYDIKQTILDAGAATDLNGTHTIYDTSYIYLKKELGLVAFINDDCITNAKLPFLINDNAKTTACIKQKYDYEFYIP